VDPDRQRDAHGRRPADGHDLQPERLRHGGRHLHRLSAVQHFAGLHLQLQIQPI